MSLGMLLHISIMRFPPDRLCEISQLRWGAFGRIILVCGYRVRSQALHGGSKASFARKGLGLSANLHVTSSTIARPICFERSL